MKFSTLLNLLGKRIDLPEVVEFAAACGAKLPLKPTTDSNDTNYFTQKKTDLEVSWSHNILLPSYYPPKKENRKYVSYITTIWFNQRDFFDYPFNISVADTEEALIQKARGIVNRSRSGVRVSFSLPENPIAKLTVYVGDDKTRWDLTIDDHNRYHYLKSDVHAHSFSPWNPQWPKQQADLPMGMFMAWCIHRWFCR